MVESMQKAVAFNSVIFLWTCLLILVVMYLVYDFRFRFQCKQKPVAAAKFQ